MAEKSPFPYRCHYLPTFKSQHEAATLIADYQARGHVKPCDHLTIASVGGLYSGPREYKPKCKEDSFDVRDIPDRHVSDYSGNLFYGCPKDCRFYASASKRKVVRWLKDAWRALRNGIVGPAQWFASLPPVTQAIIALGLLALMSSPWSNTVLEGLKVIFGKEP